MPPANRVNIRLDIGMVIPGYDVFLIRFTEGTGSSRYGHQFTTLILINRYGSVFRYITLYQEIDSCTTGRMNSGLSTPGVFTSRETRYVIRSSGGAGTRYRRTC
jgi:hypothetical protein